MLRINQIKILNDGNTIRSKEELHSLLTAQALKLLHVGKNDIKRLDIIKHSIDARKKPEIYDIYVVDVALKGDEGKALRKSRNKNISMISEKKYHFPFVYDESKPVSEERRPVIVGAGPAGIFCGYMLAEHGFKPIILERGADVDERTRAVEEFWNGGRLNPNTNVQFGEGGAGTFSDGKLNTMVKDKDGRGKRALEIFVENGAGEDILYEAKPHIGTDVLREVVKNMRNHIIEKGGQVRFNTLVSDIILDESSGVTGVKTSQGEISCNVVILAIGHSARDTFYMLKDRKVSMKPKPFAVGFRVEHPQTIINKSQYGMAEPKSLPPSPYKLTTTVDNERGVYSFCMCPGGYVVNASSEEGRLAVNGMSYSKRDGDNANSAIIITVDPSDFGGHDILSGVEFQRKLEEKAFEAGKGKIPVEYYGDFREAVEKLSGMELYDKDASVEKFDIKPQMRGEYNFGNVHDILPKELNVCFVQGMEKFGRMIKGYNSPGTLVSGVESRTSSPVRINRNEGGESENIKGLFPCGEGAGYAGGIMSAAIDGMKIAEFVAERITNG